jgi:hypothetical protein
MARNERLWLARGLAQTLTSLPVFELRILTLLVAANYDLAGNGKVYKD